MFKVNCLNPIAKCGTDLFDEKYALTEDVKEADAILVRSAQMHELELSKNTLAVARAGAGVNNIPLDKYASEGVVVFNTPGANANGVKEIVLAGLFLGSRDLIGGANWVIENASDENIAKTAEKAKKAFAGSEIKGKKLGVIGLGAIGAQVANAAVGLGMDVYGYDPYVSVEAAWNISRAVKHITNVNDIYTDCDYITIHVPLLDSTKGMVNEEAISKMKDGVIFLNFARDTLVDENAMVKASVQVNRLKPYLGFGYGDYEPKANKRYGVMLEFGVMWWGGTPRVDCYGTDLTTQHVKGEVGKYINVIKALKVFPVLNIRFSRRIF